MYLEQNDNHILGPGVYFELANSVLPYVTFTLGWALFIKYPSSCWRKIERCLTLFLKSYETALKRNVTNQRALRGEILATREGKVTDQRALRGHV